MIVRLGVVSHQILQSKSLVRSLTLYYSSSLSLSPSPHPQRPIPHHHQIQTRLPMVNSRYTHALHQVIVFGIVRGSSSARRSHILPTRFISASYICTVCSLTCARKGYNKVHSGARQSNGCSTVRHSSLRDAPE